MSDKEMIRGAVLGFPIEHSLSPVLHMAAYDFLGISGKYVAQEVKSGELSQFLAQHQDEFDYLSITMPLKEEVLEIGIELDAITSKIQSANTLYRRDGKWMMTSTDGSGALHALSHAGIKSASSVLILGAGGTARAIAGAMDSIAKSVHILGRSDLRREALEQAVTTADFSYIRWNSSIDFSEYDVVINTTPAGAADLLIDGLPSRIEATLFDVIYKPWPTVLASHWKDRGGRVISGLELLLYQGIDQIELALNINTDRSALAAHLREVLRLRSL